MTETSRLRLIDRAAFYFAFGSAVCVLFSIAAANILLVLSFAMLLMSGAKMRMPPIRLPLALFFAGTVLAVAFSGDAMAGRPAIRKFFVFLMLVVVSSTFRDVKDVRRLYLTVGLVATASALRGLAQFAWQLQHCGGDYACMVGERISGFMSHWQTFGGHMMVSLLLVGSYLFFAAPPKRAVSGWVICGCLIGAAIFAGGTRNIWLGAAVGGSYLLWCWRKWTVALLPLAAIVALLFAPPFLKQRFTSLWKPQGELDSNQHRIVSWRTGLNMIRAHPLLGIGPERMKEPAVFRQYVPADVVNLPEGWYGHLHNIYLQFAADRGVPTMLAVMWMIAVMARDFLRGLRKVPPGPDDRRFILLGALGTIVAILVGGILEHNLGDSEVLMLFLAVMSGGYVAVENA